MLQNANESEFSNTWRPMSAELSICATPLAVKFYRCRAFWAKFHFRLLFGVKFHRHHVFWRNFT
ncbi:hypothetical protein CAMGR0001_0928 [Campylobacter gracilis RM3268]|uniref:Uncharacterized protein n=1 Tax=Campylobacter gracilis RM3268 TaxID=553220 RepID=C8PGD5_9BACT|nr:hypothetical protein CAMGR0001_0928 [Campylobacter gracilis RM3268]